MNRRKRPGHHVTSYECHGQNVSSSFHRKGRNPQNRANKKLILDTPPLDEVQNQNHIFVLLIVKHI
ncbi:hypothetical protein DERP_001518 [Dermatophagoides pteronyssinus]|uniref:Uncharacterized protein n=1 Tax=Dermatophagoides pteronyssinus TaxID=6956 RepID=A0ABQ8JFG3_DERPT|nr:hypothetical protein DERP_001518 [Dermatophagoides pteronyssinus]